jgi:prolyl-tRNA editing enzyme YbaK/EbsC (Cys-tRNA(Pro) deacylase)
MPRGDVTQHVFHMRVKLLTGFVLGAVAPIGHEIVWATVWTVRSREKLLVGAGYRTPILWVSGL